jgi:hypothetical protein
MTSERTFNPSFAEPAEAQAAPISADDHAIIYQDTGTCLPDRR